MLLMHLLAPQIIRLESPPRQHGAASALECWGHQGGASGDWQWHCVAVTVGAGAAPPLRLCCCAWSTARYVCCCVPVCVVSVCALLARSLVLGAAGRWPSGCFTSPDSGSAHVRACTVHAGTGKREVSTRRPTPPLLPALVRQHCSSSLLDDRYEHALCPITHPAGWKSIGSPHRHRGHPASSQALRHTPPSRPPTSVLCLCSTRSTRATAA